MRINPLCSASHLETESARMEGLCPLEASIEKNVQNPESQAAQRALQLVKSGMTVGFGSGPVVNLWIHLLGEQFRDNDLKITAVAGSQQSLALGQSYGIPFKAIESIDRVDLTVDEVEAVAPRLTTIKGSSGNLLREKLLASASKSYVVIADASKIVNGLDKATIPVEVVPMAVSLVQGALRELGFSPLLRRCDGKPFMTAEGNLLLDCFGTMLTNPYAITAEIDAIVGVVTHGLLIDMTDLALITTKHGFTERRL